MREVGNENVGFYRSSKIVRFCSNATFYGEWILKSKNFFYIPMANWIWVERKRHRIEILISIWKKLSYFLWKISINALYLLQIVGTPPKTFEPYIWPTSKSYNFLFSQPLLVSCWSFLWCPWTRIPPWSILGVKVGKKEISLYSDT